MIVLLCTWANTSTDTLELNITYVTLSVIQVLLLTSQDRANIDTLRTPPRLNTTASWSTNVLELTPYVVGKLSISLEHMNMEVIYKAAIQVISLASQLNKNSSES